MPLRTFVLSAALAAATVMPVQAQDAGGYLAARTAIIGSDFAEAAQYFSRALARDPGNPTLLENAVTAYVGLGDMERAVPVARRLIQTGTNSQLAGLVLFADAARTGKWDTIQSDIDAGLTVGPLFDGLTRAWSMVGEGRMSEALAAFDDVGANQGVEAFGLYHKALALASVGDFEGAAEIFSGESGNTIRLTTRGLVAYAEVLSQLERNADAIELIAA
ncbi:MAG: hypothetical protein HKN02_00075, partial [Rhodobacteraceae bacterium]|nr:hypothetical protein [Paracoccaceae bacterium]